MRNLQLFRRNRFILNTPGQNPRFNTTHWSIVASSRDDDSEVRNTSLGELYQSYWYPLFAYLRRKGHSPEAAADYVQGFFVELIDKDFLESVAPEKGRFRWFMMSAVKRFVSKQKEKQNAQIRGGGNAIFSLNIDDAEQRYSREPADGWTPEKLFDRRWALEVLSQALKQLREAHEVGGKLELYEALQSTLAGESLTNDRSQQIGQQLGMSAVAVKVAAHRLKDKYRKTLTEIVSQTLTEPNDSASVDEELDMLLQALHGQ